MAVKIQKGGWALVFLIGLALVGYTLQRYGIIDVTKWTQGRGIGSGGSSGVILRIHGSNTIGAQLLPALAEAYLKQKGATGIKTVPQRPDEVLVQGVLPGQSSPQSIEIAAHGSATAFADLQDDTCDVGAASRHITADEAAKLKSRSLGDMTSPASERVLGLDGIAVIVSASNPTRSLSKEDIRKVFAGEFDNWSQLGRSQPGLISVYARDDKSGTWDTFKTLVLGDTSLSATASRMEDSRQLSDSVAGDANGIGFVGLPFVRSAKALAVSDAGTSPVFPTALTVATEDYPLSRRLYLYVPGNSRSAEARDFVSFALSKAGQELVSDNGFVGQTVVPSPMVGAAQLSAGSEVDRRYVRLTQGAVRLPLDFRFRSGSSALDNKALDDLGRVATFVSSPQYAGQNILLMGFADSMGARQKNDELSQQRAGIVADEFKARGIKVSEVLGFGAERPVASNATPEGREKNRRVEVWLRKQ